VVQIALGGGEEALYAARGLADAMLILYQGDADIFIAILPEAHPRRDGYIRLLDQQLGKFQRTELAELRRNRRPGEHAGCRRRDFPACPREGLHQHVAALTVDRPRIFDSRVL